jgi:hypothetical protein
MRASQTSILKSGTLAAGLLSAFLMPPSAAEDSHNPPPELPATLPADHLAAFNKLMSSSMERMHTDMMVAPSGDPDRDFARMMIRHHQGAVDMAKAELIYGRNKVLRRLAQGIIVSSSRRSRLCAALSPIWSPLAVDDANT